MGGSKGERREKRTGGRKRGVGERRKGGRKEKKGFRKEDSRVKHASVYSGCENVPSQKLLL